MAGGSNQHIGSTGVGSTGGSNGHSCRGWLRAGALLTAVRERTLEAQMAAIVADAGGLNLFLN